MRKSCFLLYCPVQPTGGTLPLEFKPGGNSAHFLASLCRNRSRIRLDNGNHGAGTSAVGVRQYRSICLRSAIHRRCPNLTRRSDRQPSRGPESDRHSRQRPIHGLISRSGWAVEDDSQRPLFDSADFHFLQGENSPWPWVIERPAGDRQDWYFFGYGHDYRKALGDYVRVAGRIPLPPRFAFGAWWSRYWAYSDQEIDELVRGFRENDVPLDVFVIDMDWHISNEQLKAKGETDQSNHGLGWTATRGTSCSFPTPTQFLAKLHAEGLKTSLNLHPASGVQPWEDAIPRWRRPWASIQPRRNMCPSTSPTRSSRPTT
jgi:hypothetical protein